MLSFEVFGLVFGFWVFIDVEGTKIIYWKGKQTDAYATFLFYQDKSYVLSSYIKCVSM